MKVLVRPFPFLLPRVTGNSVSRLEGVDESYHGLSHHEMDEEKLRQLAIVEQGGIMEWAAFLRKLKAGHPLPMLFLSALHRLGIEEKRFATSTGGMDRLV